LDIPIGCGRTLNDPRTDLALSQAAIKRETTVATLKVHARGAPRWPFQFLQVLSFFTIIFIGTSAKEIENMGPITNRLGKIINF